ncbi:MAG: histidine ammonia-lyase [Anaerolineaceae bacterium]
MIFLGKNLLSIDEIIKVARFHEQVEIDEIGLEKIKLSNQRLQRIIQSGKPVYGINTGFGIFADRQIRPEESSQLSRNLILSHAVGTGTPLSSEIVRAAMLVRANTLSKGFSGVRVEIVQTLLEMLNKGVTPVIPSQGSLGSSGDLCQLSHLALVFSTDQEDRDDQSGQAEFDGQMLSGKAAMQAAGIARIRLGAKEGLAINNGATFSAAIAALAVFEADYLLNLSNKATALSLEALIGCSAAFDERIHLARGHQGQIESAKAIREQFSGSTLVDSTNRVQDAYSLRCSPQILGAARDTLTHVKRIIATEINAATDNPLIFENETVLSGGNFHGEPIGMVMDYLSIAMAEVGAISERRTFRLTDEKLNQGLPPMLVDSIEAAGLNSGVMMPQYTAASLVLENQTLATPDSVHSLPTSAEQEDHNANAMTAARHCLQIIENIQHILSVELFTANRAVELRLRTQPGKLGKGTAKLNLQLKECAPYFPGDKLWGDDIHHIKKLIRDHIL